MWSTGFADNRIERAMLPGPAHDIHDIPTKETVIIEILTACGCRRCQQVKALARDVVAEFDEAQVQYREVDVVEEIDYAVHLGVLGTPAIALDGKLVFAAPPSRAKLREAILTRLGA